MDRNYVHLRGTVWKTPITRTFTTKNGNDIESWRMILRTESSYFRDGEKHTYHYEHPIECFSLEVINSLPRLHEGDWVDVICSSCCQHKSGANGIDFYPASFKITKLSDLVVLASPNG